LGSSAVRPLVLQFLIGKEGGGVGVMAGYVDVALRQSGLASGLLVCRQGPLSPSLVRIEQRGATAWRTGATEYRPVLWRCKGAPIPNLSAMLKNVRHAAQSNGFLRELLPQIRPVLVVCHQVENLGWVAPACREQGIPLVSYLHKTLAHGGLRGVFDVHRLNRFASHVVAVSHSAIEASAGRLRTPWTVIHNPVDPSCVVPVGDLRGKLGIDANAVVVASAGRITSGKGLHHFLDMAYLVSRQRPDVRFIIAGEPSKEADHAYKQSLHVQAERLGLTARVFFSGWVSMDELLGATDIFCLTSTVSEGFGLVVVESMAAGKATIASPRGGPKEILSEGGGILIDPLDSQKLASAVVALVDAPDERARLGQTARRIACDRFSLDVWKEKLLRVFAQVSPAVGKLLAGARDDGCSQPDDEGSLAGRAHESS